ILRNQAADSGGGVRISHMQGLLLDNLVRDNVAGGQGGGFDLDNDSSILRGGEITGNVAVEAGGGIAAMLWPFEGGVIEDVLIAGNRAGRGGALAIEGRYKPGTVRRVTLADNRADEVGGAVIVRASKASPANSILVGNRAGVAGGAIAYDQAAPWEPDPSFDPPARGSTATVAFLTLHDNQAPDGA